MVARRIFLFTLILALVYSTLMAQTLIVEAEGISYDSLYNRYLVSNWINGKVIAVDKSTGEQTIFAEGLGYCEHSIIVGDTLWVACNRNIKALDLANGEVLCRIAFSENPYGYRDLASDGQGHLYVVCHSFGEVYKVDVATQTYSLLINGMTRPISIEFDGANNRLILPEQHTSDINIVNLTDTSLSVIDDGLPGHEGICRDHMGNYYIGTFVSVLSNHSVYKYDPDFANPPEFLSDGFYGLVDVCYDPHAGAVAVTAYNADTVVTVPVYSRMKINGIDFNDGEYGDGDGVPEAGETIGINLSMKNMGMADADNLFVSVYFDDASLQIIDGTANLGSVALGESVSNTTDPLSFSIPSDYTARIDTLLIEATWETDKGSDEAILGYEAYIGANTILLVDDDDGDNIEQFIIEDFNDLRIPYRRWSVADSAAAPTDIDLSQYEIIIWFTGDYRTDLLDETEITALTSYMDAGGNLFLTGQGIAAQLSTENVSFLNNYLHSSYVTSSYIPIIYGAPGCQVFSEEDTIGAQGYSGASNQTVMDAISPVNGGIDEMHYFNESGCAAVSYADAYRCLFFGYGYEAILKTNPSWTSRITILLEILAFMDYTIPLTAPQVSDLQITPGECLNLIDHFPSFSWSYLDPQDLPQMQYQMQVYENYYGGSSEMWDTGPVSGSDLSVTYAGLQLEDGVSYRAQVRAHNGTLWSGWESALFRMNSRPEMPQNLSPGGSEIVTDDPLILTHDNAYDLEDDQLTYDYELYSDSQLTGLLASADDQPENASGTTGWTVPVSLDINEDYYWRVRAHDGYEYGEWSEPAGFIYSDNLPPAAFDLLNPENGAELYMEPQPTFHWSMAEDNDPGDIVTYDLFIMTGVTEPPFDSLCDLNDTTCTWTYDLDYNTLYFWSVKATDQKDAETTSAHAYSFTIVFNCGDANGDQNVNIVDASFIINWIFFGGAAPVL